MIDEIQLAARCSQTGRSCMSPASLKATANVATWKTAHQVNVRSNFETWPGLSTRAEAEARRAKAKAKGKAKAKAMSHSRDRHMPTGIGGRIPES